MDELFMTGRRWLYGLTFRALRWAALGGGGHGETARRAVCTGAGLGAGGGGPDSPLGIAAQLRAAADVRAVARRGDDWGREL